MGCTKALPPFPMKNNVLLSKKNVLLSWTNSKIFLKLCYKIIYNFTNTSPILKSSRILRFKTLNFSLNIKQSRLCFKPISGYFRCCLKVSIQGANIIDHDVAIALVIKRRTAAKINGVSKSIASYKFIYVNSFFFGRSVSTLNRLIYASVAKMFIQAALTSGAPHCVWSSVVATRGRGA